MKIIIIIFPLILKNSNLWSNKSMIKVVRKLQRRRSSVMLRQLQPSITWFEDLNNTCLSKRQITLTLTMFKQSKHISIYRDEYNMIRAIVKCKRVPTTTTDKAAFIAATEKNIDSCGTQCLWSSQNNSWYEDYLWGMGFTTKTISWWSTETTKSTILYKRLQTSRKC